MQRLEIANLAFPRLLELKLRPKNLLKYSFRAIVGLQQIFVLLILVLDKTKKTIVSIDI